MGVSQGPHQRISFFAVVEGEKYLQYISILYNKKISGPIIYIYVRHTQIGVHIPNMIQHHCLHILRVPLPFHEYEYASCSVSQGQDSKHLHNKQEVQRTTRSLKRWNTFFGRAWNTSYPCKVCCWTVGFILNVGPFLAVKRQESSLPRSQKRWFSDSLQIQMLHFGWQKPCWA